MSLSSAIRDFGAWLWRWVDEPIERRSAVRGYFRGVYQLRPRPRADEDLDRDYYLFSYVMGWITKLGLLALGLTEHLPELAQLL